MNASDKMNAKIAGLSVSVLRDMAKALVADMRDEAGIVLSATLSRLEAIMPEADFVAFCEELEAA